jgi:hypothetical protein
VGLDRCKTRFIVGELAGKPRALTEQTEYGYTLSQAGYDLTKLRRVTAS